MRLFALAVLALVISRSVLDPAAGINPAEGLILMVIGIFTVNFLFPRRGMSLLSLVALHLVTRRRKENRHAPVSQIRRPDGHQVRHRGNENRRRAA